MNVVSVIKNLISRHILIPNIGQWGIAVLQIINYGTHVAVDIVMILTIRETTLLHNGTWMLAAITLHAVYVQQYYLIMGLTTIQEDSLLDVELGLQVYAQFAGKIQPQITILYIKIIILQITPMFILDVVDVGQIHFMHYLEVSHIQEIISI